MSFYHSYILNYNKVSGEARNKEKDKLEIDCIYFDMDGVLVDFNRGQEEILKIDVVHQEHKKPGDDDLLFSKMREYDHYYYMLKPIEGSLSLFNKVYEKYGDKCRILTGVPKANRGIINASSDKKAWVEKYLSKDIVVNTVLRKEKIEYVKNKGSILIDDFSKNIKEWRERGGTGILFVSPEDTEKELRKMGIL